MLDAAEAARRALSHNLIDLGTGTGLLAFAALHLWPRAYATATDIDPIAIEVTRRECRGQRRAARRSARASSRSRSRDGIDHPLVERPRAL